MGFSFSQLRPRSAVWTHRETLPLVASPRRGTPSRILGIGFRCTWPFAPRTSAFSRSEKPRTCQPCSVKMLNGVTRRGRNMTAQTSDRESGERSRRPRLPIQAFPTALKGRAVAFGQHRVVTRQRFSTGKGRRLPPRRCSSPSDGDLLGMWPTICSASSSSRRCWHGASPRTEVRQAF